MDNDILKQRALLEAIIESSEGPIFSVDRNYLYTSFNSHHKKVMKHLFDADIEIGCNILDYHTNPDDYEQAKKNIDRAFNGESFNIESFAGDEKLEQHYFLISHNPVKDSNGKIMGAAIYAQDFTERKKAEDALRMSEDKFSKAFRNSPNAITINRLSDDKIIEGNESAYKLSGYSHDEIIGKTTAELNMWANPDDRQKLIEIFESKGFIKNEEFIFLRKDKSLLYVNLSASLITIDNQKCILTSFTDITEREKAEEKLQKTIKKLEISNAELEQFAYVASHDLQEPLRMVSSFTQLLEKKYKEKLDSDADDYIDFIIEGSHRMKDLIDDLLAFSHLNTEKKEFHFTDLNQVLDSVLLGLKSTIEEEDAHINRDKLPMVNCDSSQISQVFQNLITNSIKFHDSPPNIHVSAEEKDNKWIIGVSDEGIGIDPDHHQKIFDVFKRLHTREEYAGTGIGLSICKRIIERHGGKIWWNQSQKKEQTSISQSTNKK